MLGVLVGMFVVKFGFMMVGFDIFDIEIIGIGGYVVIL